MTELLNMLRHGMTVLQNYRAINGKYPDFVLIIFGLLLGLGILNCVLGYRLMRFWMMLAGFFMGAVIALLVVRYVLEKPWAQRNLYLGAMLIFGILMAVISFVFYRAGIFILVSVPAVVLSIYFIYPNSSLTFFLCLLIGVIFGIVALKFDREVIILITSAFGGTLAGYSLGRLLSMDNLFYNILMCAGFTCVGLLIQFLTNPRGGRVAGTEDSNTGNPADVHEDMREQREIPANRQEQRRARENVREQRRLQEESIREQRRIQEQANEDFYEEYFHGGDVFDRTTKEIQALTGESDTARGRAGGRGTESKTDPDSGRHKQTFMEEDQEEPVEDIHVLAWKQKKNRYKKKTENGPRPVFADQADE